MPGRGFINPKTSLSHKLACLTLYRALLKRSSHLPPPIQTQTTSLIKYRFRLDRTIRSAPVIRDALTTARAAYTVIRDAATGNHDATTQLTTTLSQVAAYTQEQKALRTHQLSLRRPRLPRHDARIRHERDTASKEWAARIPNPIPILERPVPKERLPFPERPRRVPTLCSAQGVPFLRYKSGAQSPRLSGVIRSMLKKDARVWNEIGALREVGVPLGECEDAWDGILRRQLGVRGDGDGGSWADVPNGALREALGAANTEKSKRRAMALRMLGVVKGERELAQREKRERRRAWEEGERERKKIAEEDCLVVTPMSEV